MKGSGVPVRLLDRKAAGWTAADRAAPDPNHGQSQ
jgi:hypothetical protein